MLRRTLKLLLLIIYCSAITVAIESVGAQESEANTVLFVYGGWEGHEPEKCRDIFVPWLEELGYEVELSTTLDSYLDSVKMANYKLIIQIFTMSRISGEQEKGLLTAIKNRYSGCRLADAFRDNTEYQFMIGG